MLTINPFEALSSDLSVDPAAMQAWVVLMVIFVIGGSIFNMIGKNSAKRTVSGAALANPRRRASHLFTMYGLVVFVVATAIMIFELPVAEGEASIWTPRLWHFSALSICIGGFWFWFKLRVDVRSEGTEWYHVHRSDPFVVSLLLMATFALIWSFLQAAFGVTSLLSISAFMVYIAASTTLFSIMPWSKFAHIFFKPAAAFQKRVAAAKGSRDKLPDVPEPSSAERNERYQDIPDYMSDNPPYTGLGIKREAPKTLTVFLSYRRADSADVAGRIYDRLLTVYDKAQIFKDVDSIPAGGDFRKYINRTIENADVFLAVIGTDWLGKSERGKRIDEADDYVRAELRSALDKDIQVIPLLVRDAKMPAEDDLPEDIRELAYRNALRIRSDPDFNNDISRLLTALNKMGTKAYPS